MSAIYNEIEPYCASWLWNLSNGGHIASGKIETRSIADLTGQDVQSATQFHTFAGIGVWSLALRLAGWPDTLPVWTGSCPCQPFSGAGHGKGTSDARHLWPAWRELIRECLPAVIFGEQVASPAGRDWFSAVRLDLEAMGYAVGCADLCAAGVGAPHMRQRLYWVAHTHLARPQGRQERRDGACEWPTWTSRMADCSDGKNRPVEPGILPLVDGTPQRVGRLRAYGNAIVAPLAATFIASFLDTLAGPDPWE